MSRYFTYFSLLFLFFILFFSGFLCRYLLWWFCLVLILCKVELLDCFLLLCIEWYYLVKLLRHRVVQVIIEYFIDYLDESLLFFSILLVQL